MRTYSLTVQFCNGDVNYTNDIKSQDIALEMYIASIREGFEKTNKAQRPTHPEIHVTYVTLILFEGAKIKQRLDSSEIPCEHQLTT